MLAYRNRGLNEVVHWENHVYVTREYYICTRWDSLTRTFHWLNGLAGGKCDG